MSIGLLTIAVGHQRYLDQARILALSSKRNMPELPLAVVTDRPSLPFADVCIPYRAEIGIGVVQKLMLDSYSPFDETLFVDSDCIVTRPFDEELAEVRRFDFTPAMERFTPIDGRDEYIRDLRGTLTSIGGTKFPKFNGGVYFFRKGDASRAVFDRARNYHRRYREMGLRAFDRSGPGEETVIGLALASLGMTDLYFDHGRLMRTPTGLKGSIEINPLGRGCKFERYDGVVSPAICHFAGPFLLSTDYKMSCYSLTHAIAPDDIGLATRVQLAAASGWDRLQQFGRHKADGLKRRIRRLIAPGAEQAISR